MNFLTFPACFYIPIIFSNTNSNLLDMRNSRNKLKKHSATKNCSSGQEKLLKLKAENFANIFRHLDQFIQTGYRNMQEKLEKVLT